MTGFNGHSFRIYDIAGRQVTSFDVDADDYVFDFGSHGGVYVVASDNGLCTKVFIK